jgi:hypothetical protein
MAIYDTFSKRQKQLSKKGESDPYRYDIFPQPLRVQVATLLTDCLGRQSEDDYEGDEAVIRWKHIHTTLAHEYGRFELAQGATAQKKCLNFLLRTNSVEECLDLVKLGFQLIRLLADEYAERQGAYEAERRQCENAIVELNYRLREHGLGYQFEEGKIIRVDSQFIHAEIVKPAIALLHEIGFAGASEEFLQAHEHYRAKRYPEAIAGALKSFESTMKGICDVRAWKYSSSATAKGLIDVILSKELIPSSLESHFSGFRSVLESGLPMLRNKQGGHGQGKDPVVVPPHLAAYALHLAASNIVMLVEAHKALK